MKEKKMAKATLTVSGTVHVGDTYTIAGSGFAPGIVNISAADPGCCSGWAVLADDNGNLSYDKLAEEPGYYVIKALGTNKGGRIVTLAEVAFSVT